MKSILSRIILFGYVSMPVGIFAQFQYGLKNSCSVLRVVTEYGSNAVSTSEFSCFCELQGEDLDGDIYKWLEIEDMPEEICKNVIRSGEVEILPNNLITEAGKLQLLPNNDWNVLVSQNKIRLTSSQGGNSQSRRLQATGTKSVLVLRGKGADTELSIGEAELSDDVFGTINDPHNLVSQYAKCSYNQLTFEPVLNNLFGAAGVYTVTITDTIANKDRQVIEMAMRNQAALDLSGTLLSFANYVMCCVPPGTAGGWLAYAYTNSYVSVYNDDWCSYPSGQMHELGHNLNLAHSGGPPHGTSFEVYQDQSGLMGYSYSQDDSPYMCFNGAKTYQLGWFTSFHHDISSDNPISWTGNLVGFVDKNITTPQDKMIIRLIDGGREDYYIHYNRKSGFNNGTITGGDLVLVTRKDNEDVVSYGESNLTAQLNAGQSYTIDNFGGQEVVISANSISGSVASVTIQSSGETSQVPSSSTNPSSFPSVFPSKSPSSIPSQFPSTMPSFSPSRFPSSVPSDTPSFLPSTNPSTEPSTEPSSLPSELPSLYPSIIPSDIPSTSPSSVPSDIPSFLPSTEPSSPPSKKPTAVPSSSPSELPSSLPSSAPSDTPSFSPSLGPSSVPSELPSLSPSLAPSHIPSFRPSLGPSSSPSIFPSYLPSSNPSDRSSSPSSTPSKLNSTPSPTMSISPSDLPSGRPSDIPSSAPSLSPSDSPSSRPSRPPSDSPSDSPSSRPSRPPSDSPSDSPSDNPSGIPSRTPSNTPSFNPSSFPTTIPSRTPSSIPSSTSELPTATTTVPSSTPSKFPSNIPSSSPTTIPSRTPSSIPSSTSELPTAITGIPSFMPSHFPSDAPSFFPTSLPSSSPSFKPSVLLSNVPSSPPTTTPSKAPSYSPSYASEAPTAKYSSTPSQLPSDAPSTFPTSNPSPSPSSNPSSLSSESPSHLPTQIPSIRPSDEPTIAQFKSPSSFPSSPPTARKGKSFGFGTGLPPSITKHHTKFFNDRPTNDYWSLAQDNETSFGFLNGVVMSKFGGSWGSNKGFSTNNFNSVGVWGGVSSNGFGNSESEGGF